MMQASERSFALALLWCLAHVCWTLTPPRIIYGGWTPIVPGHPFYFGPARQHGHYQPHQHVHYEQAHSPEHQVQYVSPQHYQNYGKPGHYQSYENPSDSPVHFQSYEKPSDSPVHYQSYEKPGSGPLHYGSHENPSGGPAQYHSYDKPDVSPVKYHQAYEKPKEVEHHVEYVSPLKYQTYKPEVGPVKYQSYDKPKVEHYAEYLSSLKHQSHDRPAKYPSHPGKYQSHDQPPQYHDQQEHITYGHKPEKNIFSYYPPQSAFDAPKGHRHGSKPVYFEVANKPLDIFHGSHLASLKDLPIDLKSLYPASGGKASLKMKPLNVDALKHIGHLNAKQIHHLVPEGKFPVLKDSSGGIPIKPAFLSMMGYKSYAPYTISHSSSAYSGGAAKPDQYLQLKRPLNPIETKYIRSAAQLHGPVIGHQVLVPPVRLAPPVRSYRHLNLPVLHPAYSSLGHLPFLKPRALQRPVVLGNPSLKNYAPAEALSYHPLNAGYASGNPPSANLLTDYLHKDVKLHSLYKNPAVVANIRGSPAIVEREVAIVHVPVEEAKTYQDSERLYHTASTPESTQVLDAARLKRLPGLGNNESYTQITLDYGKGVEHVTLVEPDGHHQADPPPPPAGDERYIFVSSSGVHGPDVQQNGVHEQAEVQKQFFHAYYGPPDHVPPPGYARMTVPEFNRLFSNAEIRYVDKRGDLDSQPSAREERRKPEEKS